MTPEEEEEFWAEARAKLVRRDTYQRMLVCWGLGEGVAWLHPAALLRGLIQELIVLHAFFPVPFFLR